MTDVVLRIQTALGGALGEVAKFRQGIADTATTAVDLREEWKATTAEIIVQTQKQIAAEKEKINTYRSEITAIREVTSSYAKGSDERQIATKMEIDLQHKLQAALGETAAVATKTARSSSSRSDLSGLGRGAASRSGVAGVGMSALAGPGFIVGAVVGGALDAGVKAAKNEQIAQANLENALKDVGQQRRISQKALEDYVVSEEHATGFQRDQVMQTLSQLIRSTGSLSAARKEEAVMADVARGRNTDLNGAMMLVMRAAEGNVGSLKRLGIEIPKITTYEDQLKAAHLTGNLALEKRAKALDLAATKTEVMRAVTQKFSGDSTAYMKTFGGETATLSNDWHDLEVEIGQKAIPTLTKLMGWLEKEITSLEKSKAVHKDLHDAVVILEDAWKASAFIIHEVDQVTGGFGNTMKILLAYFVAGKVISFAQSIEQNLVGAFQSGAKAVQGLVATVKTSNAEMVASTETAAAAEDAAMPWMAIAQVAVAAGVLIMEHWSTVKQWFTDFWGYLKQGWKDAVDIIEGIFYGWVASQILLLKGLADAAAGALGWIPGIGGSLQDAARKVDGWYTEFKTKSENAFHDIGKTSAENFINGYMSVVNGQRVIIKNGVATIGNPGTSPSTRGANDGGMGGVTLAPAGIQRNLVKTGGTAIGNKYQWGGAPSLSSPTDCSGLMVAIFAKNGISIPRTSEEQYAQAPIKNARPLAPGDLVFAEGVHPGHVGLYIGNGAVLQDPHTGASVDVIPLKDFGWNGESARWWGVKARKVGGGGGGQTTSTNLPAGWDKAVSAATAAAAAKKKAGGPVGESTIIGLKGQIAAELKGLPKDLDAVEKEAVRHIEELKAKLHVGMSQTQLAKDRVELAKWSTNLKNELKKQAAEAKKAAAAVAAAWQAGWQADVSIMNRAISEAWAKVQRSYDQETAAGLQKMQRDFQTKMTAFDEQTQTGLQSFVIGQTPEEKALADFQAQIAAQQDAQTKAQEQSDLAAAIASGDPAQIKAAQDAINQTLQQDQLNALQAAADASRTAADAKTQQEQDAYQKQRDAQKQALEDQEAQAEQSYQNQRDDQWTALNDMHDDQVTMFDADLKLWQTALKNKSKTWAQFLEWLAANPVSAAVEGGTLTNPPDFTQPSIGDSPGGSNGGGTPTGGGGGACFIGGTAIATPDGEKPIDAFEVGDPILVYDFTRRAIVASTVTEVQRHEQRMTLRVTADSREIVGTPEHLVYDGTEWTPLGAAQALYDPDSGTSAAVTEVTAGPTEKVYNLHVAHHDHNYIANGFLVHNVKKYFAGAIHYRPTVGIVGDQGPEASFPLSGQHGQAAIAQLAREIILASRGHGSGPAMVVHGTFLGATERQVARALEGLVTPAQRRVVRYPAPM